MNRIGIIAAMKPELDILLEAVEICHEIKMMGVSFYEGKIGECNVVLSLCGVGKVNAAMATTLLIKEFDCDLIINSGIAGGVSPLHKRDSVIATSLSYHDFDTTIFGYAYGQVPGMPKEFLVNPELIVLVKKIFNKLGLEYKCAKVVSGDQFITSYEQLLNVEEAGGYATEMEGAAIAQVCVKAGIDFIVLRYISDIVGEAGQEEDYLTFEKEMAERSASVTLSLLKNMN